MGGGVGGEGGEGGRVEVLDSLEEALLHFDRKATAEVQKKYMDVYK